MFKLEIETCNAAFHDEGEFEPGPEIGRILREIAEHQEECLLLNERHTIMDINGNRVGTWTLIP